MSLLLEGKTNQPTHRVGRENSIELEEPKDLYQVEGKSRPLYMVELFVNGAALQMKVDTGASARKHTVIFGNKHRS